MKKTKPIIIYSLIFLSIIFCSVLLLSFSSKVPTCKIKKNVIDSAQYFKEKELFYEIIENHNETKIDRYADSITLNITYNMESKNSFKSILLSKYYGNNKKSEIDNLLSTSTSNKYKAKTQYIRYWHGTTGILRILLIIFNIKQIYTMNLIILSLLSLLLIYKFIKSKLYILAFSFIISLVITNSFVVPFCLEYSNMYFITLIGSIILLNILKKEKENLISKLFFILGIITCFVDFLTTETMSLLMPLIILIVYKYREKERIKIKEISFLIIKLILIWAIGYVLMWITKWGLSVLFLNANLKEIVFDNLRERIGSANVLEFSFGKSLSKSVILRNVFCLFPLSYFNNQLLILIIFLFLLFTFLFFVRKSKNNTLSWILFIVAFIPYVRYIIINNHSYIHYFFTYRAQLPTILAIIIGSYYMIDKNLIFKRKRNHPNK